VITQATADAIARKIEKNFEEQVKFLAKLVQAKSPNPYNPQESSVEMPIEKEVGELIFQKLQESGFEPRKMGASRERSNILVEWGEKRARNSLMFNGHMDTVPPEREDVISPYSGSVRGGKLYGLGALDMKGALSAYVYAAKALKEAGVELTGKLYLAFVVDEESGACSRWGTQYLLEEGVVPRACIIGEHGSRIIRIGQRGVYRFKLVTKGEAVHTGVSAWERKELGKNAIVEMMKAVEALKNLEIPYKPAKTFAGRKPVFTFPLKISGGKALNMVPERCEAYGDVRLLPGNSDTQVKMLMVERLQKLRLEYELIDLMFVPAAEVDPREQIVEVMAKQVKEVVGVAPQLKGAGPGTDGWMMAKREVATVFGYGPDGSGEHGQGEWVDLNSLKKVTEVYARTAAEFLS